MSWNRKIPHLILYGLCAQLLASCADFGGDAASIYQVGKVLWKGPREVSLSEAATSPYASIGVRVGGRDQFMLILATNSGGRQLWTSAARIAVVTSQGRIVRMTGFGKEMALTRSATSNDSAQRLAWEADFPDRKLYSAHMTCERGAVRKENIVILGKIMRTLRVEESCKVQSGAFGWSFKNTFWLDPQNSMPWRSIQHVHPDLPALEITVLRPSV